MRLVVILVGCGWLLAAAPARAEPDAVTLSRIHYRAGEALYRQGDFPGALREWQAGYELAPRPDFLINLGQAYRQMGQPDRALAMFEKYLAATPPDDPRRTAVEQLAAAARAQRVNSPESPPPASEKPPPPVSEKPVSVSAPVVVAAPPPARRSFARRHWWIFPVVGAAVAVGVGLGVYYGLQSGNSFSCGPQYFVCNDAR